MNVWIDVCSLNDLQPDSGVCALVEDMQVAIFYLAKIGQVFAIANYDPIGKANVLSRGMVGDLHGKPMVASPLHKQHYDLVTGNCFEHDGIQLKTYPVRLLNNRVEIGL